MSTDHILTKPFATHAAAHRYSLRFVPGARLAAHGITDAHRVLPIDGGYAALFGPHRSDRRFDVYHGARGAATRRQISDDE